MKIVILAGSALILSGCVSPEMIAAEDTRACIRMGAVAQGKMLECELAKQSMRQQEDLHRRRAIGALGRAMMAPQQPRYTPPPQAPMPVRCNTTYSNNRYVGVTANTRCY